MAQVINQKDAPDNWRDNPLFISLLVPPWSNPYQLGVEAMSSEELLSLYIAWLKAQVLANGSFPVRIRGLCGKVLVGSSSPAPSHGDFLAYLADGLGVYEFGKGRYLEDFCYVSIFNDQQRNYHMRDLIDQIAVKHGRRIRGEMKAQAIQAAKDELGQGADIDKWKAFRRKWLSPLLRWDMPQYKQPMTGETN